MVEQNYWQRLSSRRRISRRAMLRGTALAGAGLAGAALIGCGDDDDDDAAPPAASGGGGGGTGAAATTAPTTAPAGGPARGGTFKTYYTEESQHLDPHNAPDSRQSRVAGMVYNGLLQHTEPVPGDIQVRPDLAETFEVVDAATYRFTLRDGVTFHDKAPVDGRALDIDDVKLSYERLASDKAYRGISGNFKLIDSMETVDAKTFVVRLSQPFATFSTQAGSVFAMIAPKEMIEDDDLLRQDMIGTGPFILDKWDPPVGFEFKQNPNYFKQSSTSDQLPYMDGVRQSVIADTEVIRANFVSGNLDFMSVALSDVEALKSAVPDASVQTFQATGGHYIYFNVLKEPFNDVRVRRAIMLATDPAEYIAILQEGLAKRDGIISAGFPAYAWENERLWTPDPAEAKKLLEAGNYAPGDIEVDFVVGPAFLSDFAVIAKRQLEAIGITVNLVPGDFGTWVDTIINCDKFAMEHWIFSAYTTPDRYMFPYWHSEDGYDCWYHSETLDSNLEAARAATDPDDSVALYDKIQQEIMDNVGAVPIYSGVSTIAFQDWVEGAVVGLGENATHRHLEDVWLSNL